MSYYGSMGSGMGGAQVFSTLGWSISGAKMMEAYLLLVVWLVAVVFTILAFTQGNADGDAEKQKKFNLYTNITALSVLLMIFLALRIATA